MSFHAVRGLLPFLLLIEMDKSGERCQSLKAKYPEKSLEECNKSQSRFLDDLNVLVPQRRRVKNLAQMLKTSVTT